MKRSHKAVKRILISLGVILLVPVSTLFMPFSFSNAQGTDDFSSVMKDAEIPLNKKVTEIAMLGAHDALSGGISYGSASDPYEGGITSNGFVSTIGKGLCVRESKSQLADAKELLYSGVRYMDVRISLIDDAYYTVHGYVSNLLKDSLMEVTEFLESNPGEFILFDIQHFYTENGKNYELSKTEYDDLFTYMDSVKTESGHSLLDYVYYDAQKDSLSSLTYGDVTENGSKGGAIILAKTWSSPYAYMRDNDASYDTLSYYSVRSLWHKTSSTNKLIAGINEEFAYLKENNPKGIFVINQAQKTQALSNIEILGGFFQWSLIDMAASSNKKLTSDEETFKKWLSVMPIFMVDFATSTKGDFNTLANTYIKEFNMGLK